MDIHQVHTFPVSRFDHLTSEIMERYLVIIRSHLAEYVHHRKRSPPKLHKLTAIRPGQRDSYLCNTDRLHRSPVPFLTLNPEEEITLHLKASRWLWPIPEATRSVRANNDSTVKCQAVHLSSRRSVQQPLGPGWRRVRIQGQNQHFNSAHLGLKRHHACSHLPLPMQTRAPGARARVL